MFFFVITKNFNWEILTKDRMGIRIKNFTVIGVH